MILSPNQVARIDRSVSYVGDGRTVNDLLETIEFYQSIDGSKAPCGHLERYTYTEDAGKHIVCLLCEYGEKKPTPTKTRKRKPRKSDGQTAGWIGVIKRMGKE